MIKYKYAYNVEKDIISVSELSREQYQKNKEKYFCIVCNKELIPKLGNDRKHHFAHYSESDCSFETYLHKLAKEKFYQIYSECIQTNTPFYLEYKITEKCSYCKKYGMPPCEYPATDKFNLVDKYKIIEVEKKDGDRIPDILLRDENSQNNNDSIHIEFAVTHRTEKPKKRTVEFILETEDDLNLFTGKRIPIFSFFSEKKSKIKRYHFQNNKTKDVSFKETCVKSLYAVRVYKNGKFEFAEEKINEFENRLNNPDIKYSKVLSSIYNSHKTYLKELFLAYVNNRNIRNCDLCKYRDYNWYRTDNGLFCRKNWKDIVSDDALNCGSFTIFKKVN